MFDQAIIPGSGKAFKLGWVAVFTDCTSICD